MERQQSKHSVFQRRPAGAARNRGLSLLEVLVALKILTMGLMGLAALHADTARQAYAVWLHERAQVLLRELVAAARIDPVLAGSLSDLTPETPATDCWRGWGPMSTMAYWEARLACDLPDAVLSVQREFGQTRLLLTWAPVGTDSGAVSEAQVTVGGLP